MFDGKVKGTRQVNLSGKNAKTDSKSTKDLIEHARKQREARAVDRQRSLAVTKIQKIVRSKMTRNRWFVNLRIQFDQKLTETNRELGPTNINALTSFLPVFFSSAVDASRLVAVCTLLSNILSLQDKSIPSILGEVMSCVTNSYGQNTYRRIARVLELAMSELAHENSGNVDAGASQVLLLSLQRSDLSASPVQENRTIGTLLALYVAPTAARALRQLDAQAHALRVESKDSTSRGALTRELQRILTQALDFSGASFPGSEEVKSVLEGIRKVSISTTLTLLGLFFAAQVII
jgi:hypothetical protein